MQNEYLLLKIDFQSGNFVLNDFWKQKVYFLTLDNIFILDNFSFVQDKNCFVRAEGRGLDSTNQASICKIWTK
jgi:hypothetical protein